MRLEKLFSYKNSIKNKISHFRQVWKMTNNRGWILPDAIIGMMVLVVGLCAITLALTQATKTSMFSSSHSQATYIAQNSLEYFKKYDGASATDANTTITELSRLQADAGLPTVPAGYTRTFPDTGYSYDSVNKLVTVTVTVAKTDKPAETVTLHSYYYLQ